MNSCTSVLLYSCTLVLSCTPLLPYSCTLVLLYCCAPVFLYSCIHVPEPVLDPLEVSVVFGPDDSGLRVSRGPAVQSDTGTWR